MVDEINNEVIEEEVLAESDIEATSDESIDPTEESFTPSFTYKVKDEEREFDERLRDIVKDKETEDYVRDLYTRADGLDSYKEKVKTYEDSLRESSSQVSQLTDFYKGLSSMRDSKNYRQLFGQLGIDEESLLEYAYSVANEATLPEEQRQYISQNREYQDRLSHLENELNSYRQATEQQTVENDLRELESCVSTYKDLDERMKGAGFNLRDEILSHGIATTKITGKEPTIEQATIAVVERFNKLFTPKDSDIEQTINNRPAALPKINGTNQTSPEKRLSLDDLRKMADAIPNG